MKTLIDYRKSPCPKADAVNDAKEHLGTAKWDMLFSYLKNENNPQQFIDWCGFVGIEGFPVGAIYDLIHGEGAWAEATLEPVL